MSVCSVRADNGQEATSVGNALRVMGVGDAPRAAGGGDGRPMTTKQESVMHHKLYCESRERRESQRDPAMTDAL